MIHQTIKLREVFPRLPHQTEFEPILTVYCPENSPEIDPKRKRASILICPGGGYTFTSDREAEPIALNFVSRGYNAFVLRYSVAPARYPTALLEVSAAMALIRSRAEEWNVRKDAVIVCGFSAGGHLGCSLGAFWNEPFIEQTLGIEHGQNRPDGMILCYPVITSGPFAHRGSFDNLVADGGDELLSKVSLEHRVGGQTPPAFIWHTFDDEAVPVENSLLLASALRKAEVPFELHIYPTGVHGLSLCNDLTSRKPEQNNPHAATWFKLCDQWLRMTFKN